ncbi:uncharacterized protein LOC116572311 [Mustela erminea]|uniref:uncharacterized protein LOC116572311 n=1 Tax=Mustela erminea TaxID=36723 RepID=UPI001387610D|nr:uncharacterized protein LOC116572311 [Mustela erminea]XP_032167091.1 uncharacterized protein LOC116572311 [Mustela erminea]XP_032167092.1 uncharacterized protein LOC116572311 [Mustela erminea]XP_032167093.1 uncharacterized protein LOC116572311 [Mustela erminea]
MSAGKSLLDFREGSWDSFLKKAESLGAACNVRAGQQSPAVSRSWLHSPSWPWISAPLHSGSVALGDGQPGRLHVPVCNLQQNKRPQSEPERRARGLRRAVPTATVPTGNTSPLLSLSRSRSKQSWSDPRGEEIHVPPMRSKLDPGWDEGGHEATQHIPTNTYSTDFLLYLSSSLLPLFPGRNRYWLHVNIRITVCSGGTSGSMQNHLESWPSGLRLCSQERCPCLEAASATVPKLDACATWCFFFQVLTSGQNPL